MCKGKAGCLRFVAGVVGAFLLVLFTAVLAQAGSPQQEQPPPGQEPLLDCRECHWDIYLNWEQSAHGRGLTCGQCHLADQEDHARRGHGAQGGAQACMDCHTTGYNATTDTWQEDDVHCTACHTPVDPNHPDAPMPTDRSEALCGRCHIQARFEWQVSAHGQAGVVCVSCHSQHNTSLKEKSVSAQCADCHETHAEGFSHSIHYEQGLSCANCHLAPLEGPLGEGSAKRSHTFDVDVKTCVGCHEEGLHNATDHTHPAAPVVYQPEPSGAYDPTDALSSAIEAKVKPEPEPLNPLGFAALGGTLLGVAVAGVIVGMSAILLPWFIHVFRHR